MSSDPPPQLHLTLCCLSLYPLLRFTSIHSFPAKLTGSDSASLWEGSLPLFHRALQISVWAALSYLGVSGGGSLLGACRLPGCSEHPAGLSSLLLWGPTCKCGTSVGLCPLEWLEAALLSEYLLSGWILQEPCRDPLGPGVQHTQEPVISP